MNYVGLTRDGCLLRYIAKIFIFSPTYPASFVFFLLFYVFDITIPFVLNIPNKYKNKYNIGTTGRGTESRQNAYFMCFPQSHMIPHKKGGSDPPPHAFTLTILYCIPEALLLLLW